MPDNLGPRSESAERIRYDTRADALTALKRDMFHLAGVIDMLTQRGCKPATMRDLRKLAQEWQELYDKMESMQEVSRERLAAFRSDS
jgi:hypothetical protein